MSKLDPLHTKVEETATVIDSAVELITGLAQRLREALSGEDVSAEVESLVAELEQHKEALAAAVSANTPAA